MPNEMQNAKLNWLQEQRGLLLSRRQTVPTKHLLEETVIGVEVRVSEELHLEKMTERGQIS